mgnify:CR=1 FL=1
MPQGTLKINNRSSLHRMETSPQIYAYQSVKSTTHTPTQKKRVFRYGQYLYRKSEPRTGRTIEKNIQTHQ